MLDALGAARVSSIVRPLMRHRLRGFFCALLSLIVVFPAAWLSELGTTDWDANFRYERLHDSRSGGTFRSARGTGDKSNPPPTKASKPTSPELIDGGHDTAANGIAVREVGVQSLPGNGDSDVALVANRYLAARGRPGNR